MKLTEITRHWHIIKRQNPLTGQWELVAERHDKNGHKIRVERNYLQLPSAIDFYDFVLHLKQFSPKEAIEQK